MDVVVVVVVQSRWLGENSPVNPGHCIDFLNRNTKMVLATARVAMAVSLCDLLAGLTDVEKVRRGRA